MRLAARPPVFRPVAGGLARLLPLLVLAACDGAADDSKPVDDTAAAPVDDCPIVSIDHTALTWTDVAIGSSTTQALALGNSCTGETGLTLTVSQAGSDAFTTDLADLAIAPGAVATLSVTYSPTRAAGDAGTLTLATNDADRPEIAVTLSGTPLADADGDGAAAVDDCDDANPDAYPGALETWYDGVDEACDGGSDYDRDGDGMDALSYGGTDCDDGAATTFPGATDTWYDGVDADCAGDDDYDADADGFTSEDFGGDDCDDADATVHPGAADVPGDGYDLDCNGSDADGDGDGFDGTDYGGDDCDDADAAIFPGAADIPYDGVDADCSGSDYDADGDGYVASAYAGDDCDDSDASVYPGAADAPYDGVDADCAGDTDYDADGDGYLVDTYGGTDCDDTSASVSPAATDTWYDGVDTDCDGASDYDADGDGFDSDIYGGDDCDDADAAVSPGATETWYDGLDGDCDRADDYDQDGDGADVFPTGDDCDDTDATTTEGVAETRNGLDDDCDGQLDEGLVLAGDVVITEVMVNPDAVSDTVGEWFEVHNVSAYAIDLNGWIVYSDDGSRFTVDAAVPIAAGDYAVLGADADPLANGGVTVDYAYDRIDFALAEAGDSIYLVDDATTVAELSFPASWGASAGATMQLDPDHLYAAGAADAGNWCVATDAFGSGDLGTPRATNVDCDIDEDGDGFSPPDGDCDDDDSTVYPGAYEGLDGIDNDCDGTVDDGASDDDGDGYSEAAGDCDDADGSVSPAAAETCNGLDDDCDGVTDPVGSDSCATYWYDYDGDGYGSDSVASVCACGATGYYTATAAGDCYDYNASASPAASSWSTSQRGDGSYDWNCDGAQTKLYTDSGSCDYWRGCSTTAGWTSSTPSCGSTGNYLYNCSLDWFSCSEDTVSVTQACL
jgi:hypothetical protein